MRHVEGAVLETFGRDDGVPVRDDHRYKLPDGIVGTPGANAKTEKGRQKMRRLGAEFGPIAAENSGVAAKFREDRAEYEQREEKSAAMDEMDEAPETQRRMGKDCY